jgi:hypothetical protein
MHIWSDLVAAVYDGGQVYELSTTSHFRTHKGKCELTLTATLTGTFWTAKGEGVFEVELIRDDTLLTAKDVGCVEFVVGRGSKEGFESSISANGPVA